MGRSFLQCPLFIVFGLIETEVTVINRGTGRKKYVLQDMYHSSFLSDLQNRRLVIELTI